MRCIGAMSALALAAGAVPLGGCSDSNLGEVSLQLASQGPAAAAMDGSGQLVLTRGADEIVVSEIQIVLRKLRLDGDPALSCPADTEGDTRCAELRFGPVLFDLPLGEGAEPTLSAAVPVGTYHRLKLQIHRPTNAGADADFLAGHPEFEDVSIRVLGSYNGAAFSFASDLTEVEDIVFPEPLEVGSAGTLQVTLRVEVAGWFASADGSGLVDPAAANDGGPFESLVERQIRESFRAFHDADRDGAAD